MEAKAPQQAGAEYQEVAVDFPWAGATCFRGNVPTPQRSGAGIPAQMWWACERDILIEIGGFDERFTVYGAEDLDVFARLGRKGLKIHWMPRMFAVGLWAPRKAGPRDVINVEQNRKQHELWRADATIVRNEGVDWGRQHVIKPD